MAGDSIVSLAHPSFALAPGQRLAGRYLIEDELGRGGMGVVYRARDEQEERVVAVKTILSSSGGTRVRRFRLEVRALKSLQHPHIVTVHDSDQVEGLPFYVMEYIEGPDLTQLLSQRGGPLTVAETVTIGVQVGQALAYLHNQGKIHRDVKPSNIMVLQPDPGSPLHVKLMDFGLIKTTDVSARLTASGVWLGTLPYLSPEQLKGLPVDRRSDLYALGLVLFELCTASFAFSAPDVLSLAYQRLVSPPIAPRQLRPDLPLALEKVILKLLSADLNGRYALAEELLVDLAPLAQESVVLAAAPLSRADLVVRSPLVGRAKELERLAGWLHAAWDSLGQFILVEGEAGVGKTRLSQELAGLARQLKGRQLLGACYEEEHLPYGPFAEALRDVVSDADERFASLLKGLRPELARLIPTLALPLAEAPTLEPEQARLRLFDAVTRFLVRLSQRRPLVLIFEDLQWADDGTLELLHYLVRNSRDAAIFVCGTARQEELEAGHPLIALFQAMMRRGLAQRLTLERLPLEAVADMVPAMLAGGPPPTQLAERLYHEAEGNPLFVEEMLKAWVEEGRLVWERGRWNLGDDARGVSALSMPASIAGVVARRLERVSGTEQDVLGLAAVLGREFNFDVLLRMVSELGEDTLLDVVEDLLRAHLLQAIDHPREDRYRFTHNKFQDMVYERAGASRRRLRRAHRDAGEALEGVYAGRLDRVVDPLARHFLAAGDRRVVGYGLQAGDAARAVYANQEALGYYDQALALAASMEEQGDNEGLVEQVIALRSGIAGIHFLVGEYEQAGKGHQAALELLPQAQLEADERRQKTSSIHRRLADVYEAQGRYEEAMAEFVVALKALQVAPGDSHELAQIYQRIGWLQMRQGIYDEAIVSCEKGLQAIPPGDHAAAADLDDTLGNIYRNRGEYARAATHHQHSLALREQLGDQAGIAKTCNNLALVNWNQGDYEQAIAYSQRSLTISEAIGHSEGVASLYNNLGAIYRHLKQYDQAIDFYQRALAAYEQIGNQLGIAIALGNLGEAHRDKGDLAQAIEYVKEALDKSVEMGDREGETIAHQLLAEIHLILGNMVQAIQAGQRALDVADLMGARPYQANAHKVLGQAFLAQGQRNQARTHLDAARRLFGDLDDEEEAAVAETALRALENQ